MSDRSKYPNFTIDWSKYPNFTEAEFRCHCGCGRADMDPDFMALLQSLRSELAVPLGINSGFRCPDHNAAVSSTGRTGPHTTGKAADIHADSRVAFLLVKTALRRGVARFGLGKTFVHLDTSDAHPKNRAWTY